MKLNHLLVMCVLSCGIAPAATIFSDGFEPGPEGSFTSVPAVSTIGPWTVGLGGVDWIGSYWTPAAGSASVDLSALAPGSVFTTLSTVAGQSYVLNFSLAGNPDLAGVKTVHVTVGDFVGDFSFDTTGMSLGAMGWVGQTASFKASSSSDVLTFAAAAGSGAYGPAIDAVSVSDVPEPATYGMMGLGLAALGLFARRRKA